MAHEIITITAKIVNQASGIATPTDPASEILIPSSPTMLGRFKKDSIVEIALRVSSSTSHIISVREFRPPKTDSASTADDYLEVEAQETNEIDEYKMIYGVYFSPEMLKLFDAIDNIASTLGTFNVMLLGNSGYGKTSLIEAFAKETNREFLRVDCSLIRDPEEWFGYREAIDGSTAFVKKEFTHLVERGNAIILMDEFNRLEPALSNSLFPLLDHARRTKVHEYEIIVGPNVVFAATVNIGFQYVGTFQLDKAITNRFNAFAKVGPLPHDIEVDLLVKLFDIQRAKAKRIVNIMSKLRASNDEEQTFDASTRASKNVALLVKYGKLSIEEAFNAVIAAIDESKSIQDAVKLS